MPLHHNLIFLSRMRKCCELSRARAVEVGLEEVSGRDYEVVDFRMHMLWLDLLMSSGSDTKLE